MPRLGSFPKLKRGLDPVEGAIKGSLVDVGSREALFTEVEPLTILLNCKLEPTGEHAGYS